MGAKVRGVWGTDDGEGSGPDLPAVELSVVLAVRDFEQAIGPILEQLAAWIRRSRQRTEVVVVDDGSDDSTDQAAALWRKHFDGFQVCRHGKQRGVGAGARTGVWTARGQRVVIADPELFLFLENAESLLRRIDAGADVAVLSRRLPLAELDVGLEPERPFLERAAESTFLAVSRLFVPTGVRDGLCPLMALRQRTAKKLAERGRIDGPAYALEWLGMARLLGFHVIESPLHSIPDRRASLLSAASAPGMLRDLWKTHRRLAADDLTAQPTASLLHETSFVKLDRSELIAASGRDGN
jgi:hypothetical protein